MFISTRTVTVPTQTYTPTATVPTQTYTPTGIDIFYYLISE